MRRTYAQLQEVGTYWCIKEKSLQHGIECFNEIVLKQLEALTRVSISIGRLKVYARLRCFSITTPFFAFNQGRTDLR